jgi:hypothetical protein
MLRAYLDDSGSDDSDVLACGGGISWPGKWGEFEHELRSFLTTHSLDMLHMCELKWDGENNDGPIVRGAFSLVHQYVECYVGCSVRAADPALKRYHDAGLACVEAVIDLVEERGLMNKWRSYSSRPKASPARWRLLSEMPSSTNLGNRHGIGSQVFTPGRNTRSRLEPPTSLPTPTV